LRDSKGEVLNYALHLLFSAINNINNTVEYETMIVGLQIAKEVRAREVNMFSDSQLAIMQVNDKTRVLDGMLARYKENLVALTLDFKKVQIQYVP
jgi:ribonuclease HI